MEHNKIPPEQIGFDFDGVIADIGEAFLRMACEEHNYCSFKLEDLTSFNVESCTNIPESVVDEIFSNILTDSLATGLLPISGALNVLADITKFTKVTIITARTFAEPVNKWFTNYLTREVCQQINTIAMSDHDMKVSYIQQRNLTYFIDDRAETCKQVANAGLTPILFRQPWNHSSNGFSTVSNWDQIADLLNI